MNPVGRPLQEKLGGVSLRETERPLPGGWGERGIGSCSVTGDRVSILQDAKSSRHEWRRRLHNSVNGPNATQLHCLHSGSDGTAPVVRMARSLGWGRGRPWQGLDYERILRGGSKWLSKVLRNKQEGDELLTGRIEG